jgi:hypothetical protein
MQAFIAMVTLSDIVNKKISGIWNYQSFTGVSLKSTVSY